MSKKRAVSWFESACKRPQSHLSLEEMRQSNRSDARRLPSLEREIAALLREAEDIRSRTRAREVEIAAREIEIAYAAASETKNVAALTDPERGVFRLLGLVALNPHQFRGPFFWIGDDGSCSRILRDIPAASAKGHSIDFLIDHGACTMRRSARSKRVGLWYTTVQEFLYVLMRMCRIPLEHAHHVFPMIFIKSE